jgi:hypothetical protein
VSHQRVRLKPHRTQALQGFFIRHTVEPIGSHVPQQPISLAFLGTKQIMAALPMEMCEADQRFTQLVLMDLPQPQSTLIVQPVQTRIGKHPGMEIQKKSLSIRQITRSIGKTHSNLAWEESMLMAQIVSSSQLVAITERSLSQLMRQAPTFIRFKIQFFAESR